MFEVELLLLQHRNLFVPLYTNKGLVKSRPTRLIFIAIIAITVCATRRIYSIMNADVTISPIRTVSPTVNCSLTASASSGAVDVSIQWSPSFTSQHAVERYRVSVSPDPSSCSSDQVSPSEGYSCSGLVLGTPYTFTVSAITDCGGEDQEGERDSFTVLPQGIDLATLRAVSTRKWTLLCFS